MVIAQDSRSLNKDRPSGGDILTSVGETVYEWNLVNDRLSWSGNAPQILGMLSLGSIATGAQYKSCLHACSDTCRWDFLKHCSETDKGDGVPYQIHYALSPDIGESEAPFWIEDTGRWFAGEDGRPSRAHGVVRAMGAEHGRQKIAAQGGLDDLTGQLNRQGFLIELENAIEEGTTKRELTCLMIVQIENLRVINEAYGFDIADDVIAAVAHRLKIRLRDADCAGRLAGNKIGLLLRKCTEDDMHIAAKRFIAAVREEMFQTRLGTVLVSISIGGVLVPRHARRVRGAETKALQALGDARSNLPGSFCEYLPSPNLEKTRLREARLADEVIRAVNERRIELYYQPIVTASDHQVHHYEALLRVRSTSGEKMAAGPFVETCEKLGLVRLLDFRVLEIALDQLARYDECRLAINVSPEGATDPEWLSLLCAFASRHPGIASRLTVEITETAAIRHLEEATRFVSTLKELGCQVAIDDFGSGYTSFRNLQALSVDSVKIDGSFIKSIRESSEDRAFVTMFTNLAKELGVETVAEWVEDIESAELLRDIGVTYLQGFYFGSAQAERPWANDKKQRVCGKDLTLSNSVDTSA